MLNPELFGLDIGLFIDLAHNAPTEALTSIQTSEP
jgi:hypothetical protein